MSALDPEERRELWSIVTSRVGFSLPDEYRRLIELEGDLNGYSSDPAGTVERIKGRVDRLRQAGVLADPQALQAGQVAAADPHWRLIADLIAQHRFERSGEQSQWRPITFAQASGFDVELPRLKARRVTASFDSRLALRSVTSAIRAAWPELRERGLLRRTRPLGARSLALVRHVCVKRDRSDSWATRWRSWEQQYTKEQPAWSYPSASRFNSAFHNAERRLAGPRSLAPFYDEVAFLQHLSLNELAERAKRDRLARGVIEANAAILGRIAGPLFGRAPASSEETGEAAIRKYLKEHGYVETPTDER